ncbi:MAG: TetR/AcrR family transcriptional regulator [Alphaproteobacteria bacterium]|nr:TetR/AcrR family transcriptional regulator [Alphaproteobacteria bacterium]
MEPVLKTRERKRETDRRAGIIEIAHAAFLADGYAATSMSAIAARLGGSKGTLYNYFPSKEDLFVAVIETRCEEIMAFIYEVELEGGDFAQALNRLGRRFLGFALGEEAIATYRLVTAESGRFPEVGRALYERGFQRGIARLAAYFERAVEQGHLRAGDLRRAAEQFFDLCKSGLHHRRLWNVSPMAGEEEIAAHVGGAVETFLAAYAAAD